MVRFVVVAEKVQQPVQSQHSPFSALVVSGLARLPARDAARDDDIAKERVESALSWSLESVAWSPEPGARRLETRARSPEPARERQNVSRGILATVAAIHGADPRIRDDGDGHRASPPHRCHARQPRAKPVSAQRTAVSVDDGYGKRDTSRALGHERLRPDG